MTAATTPVAVAATTIAELLLLLGVASAVGTMTGVRDRTTGTSARGTRALLVSKEKASRNLLCPLNVITKMSDLAFPCMFGICSVL